MLTSQNIILVVKFSTSTEAKTLWATLGIGDSKRSGLKEGVL
jgi:hypothetical protein